ncbi:MAG: long-chain fatty acid--CoA ligase [Alphaproteobacteria bacterium]|nr:long-chain fatty acid--CoA ligase [Alphaproteobacteria bacterium]
MAWRWSPGVPSPSGSVEQAPWHHAWPGHLLIALDYPEVPAWWLLQRNLERFPDRPALRLIDHESGIESNSLSYRELWHSAVALAGGFQELGVGRGGRVALALGNCAELVMGYHAAWLLGATAVPINPALTEGEATRQLADAEAGILLAAASGAEVAGKIAANLAIPLVLAGESEAAPPPGALSFAELLDPSAEEIAPCPVDPADDVAVLLYTGGTTGLPKGAMLSHRNIVANTMQFAEWYAFEPGAETCIGALPMFHSGGMSGALNVPLYAGATILMFQHFRPAVIARAVEQYRATRLFGVPTMFIALLNNETAKNADYSSLRACRTSAAPLPASVKAAFDGLVGREVLIEGYGLTETSPLTHANPMHRAKPGSIGIPLPDTDAKVVDPDSGADLAVGEVGELVIRGPQVMKAYWNRPEETAEAMAGGWFHTGDIAEMDAEGYFTIVDRKKDLINSAGYKIWPREVEEVIYTHPGVQLAAVTGQPDDYWGEVVKAFVVLKEGHRGQVAEADIVAFCKQSLVGYKVPRAVEFRDELPLSATGKMFRRLLKE